MVHHVKFGNKPVPYIMVFMVEFMVEYAILRALLKM